MAPLPVVAFSNAGAMDSFPCATSSSPPVYLPRLGCHRHQHQARQGGGGSARNEERRGVLGRICQLDRGRKHTAANCLRVGEERRVCMPVVVPALSTAIRSVRRNLDVLDAFHTAEPPCSVVGPQAEVSHAIIDPLELLARQPLVACNALGLEGHAVAAHDPAQGTVSTYASAVQHMFFRSHPACRCRFADAAMIWSHSCAEKAAGRVTGGPASVVLCLCGAGPGGGGESLHGDGVGDGGSFLFALFFCNTPLSVASCHGMPSQYSSCARGAEAPMLVEGWRFDAGDWMQSTDLLRIASARRQQNKQENGQQPKLAQTRLEYLNPHLNPADRARPVVVTVVEVRGRCPCRWAFPPPWPRQHQFPRANSRPCMKTRPAGHSPRSS